VLQELYYNPRDSLFPRIISFNKVSPELVYELFTYKYLNFLYPSLGLIELQKFPKSSKKAIKDFSKGYVCLPFFLISLEKDEDKISIAIHLVEISKSPLKLISRLTKTNFSRLQHLTNHALTIKDQLVPNAKANG